jgi:hypothetical protein
VITPIHGRGTGDKIQCELKATVNRICEVKMAFLGATILLSQMGQGI